MDITQEVQNIIGNSEGINIEYKAVLPPSKNIAKIICSFANTEGGFIILGVSDNLEIIGLSNDFYANSITHKALDLLSPKPIVHYQYITFKNKKLYIIKVEKANIQIVLEGNVYIRDGATSKLLKPVEVQFRHNGYSKIITINKEVENFKTNATHSKIRLLEHYQSILKIVDDLSILLYPLNPNIPTNSSEGKILSRILYSSFVDNFETYLSDLLYEIFLALPNTLKSKQTVTIEEVLNCSDIEDFIKYWANQKIGKLQKGSVNGFIKDNRQIRELEAINKVQQLEIERILQIRHLYSHRNGIIDDKFLRYFPGEFSQNEEHQMSIDEICSKLEYLAKVVDNIDSKALKKYSLATHN